ncbi:MAG: helix-turn-helix domain-containing protein [Dyadobacter sp.]|uniref:helix-turn-helix domain-containing protein n=1 Tax=Dyadobacter sp. TaxID=1914288 RepID=UPI0032660590
MDNTIHFGLIINQLREEKKLTKEKFAKLVGYTPANLGKILNKEDVGTDILKKVCEAFDLDMSFFLVRKGYIHQKGNANIAGNGNVQYKGENNSINADNNKMEFVLNENEHLKARIKLLEEMVEILKSKT